jgi:uncharacterized membrane protein
MADDTRVFEVAQSAAELYQKWSRFEGLKDYSPSLKEICKTGDHSAHIVIEHLGECYEWDAEITQSEENCRLEWVSTSGLQNRGEVLFEPLGPNRTRITIHYVYQSAQETTGATEYDQALSAAR